MRQALSRRSPNSERLFGGQLTYSRAPQHPHLLHVPRDQGSHARGDGRRYIGIRISGKFIAYLVLTDRILPSGHQSSTPATSSQLGASRRTSERRPWPTSSSASLSNPPAERATQLGLPAQRRGSQPSHRCKARTLTRRGEGVNAFGLKTTSRLF